MKLFPFGFFPIWFLLITSHFCLGRSLWRHTWLSLTFMLNYVHVKFMLKNLFTTPFKYIQNPNTFQHNYVLTLVQSPRIFTVIAYKFSFYFYSTRLDSTGWSQWSFKNPKHLMLFLSSKSSNSFPALSEWTLNTHLRIYKVLSAMTSSFWKLHLPLFTPLASSYFLGR